jgi:hypothetical protein
MNDWMIARMSSRTYLPTFRPLSAARNGRQFEFMSTTTGQLIPTNIPTLRTTAVMTQLFTRMATARQLLSANLFTSMFVINTTLIETLMSSALTLFITSLFTNEWIRFSVFSNN